MKKLNKKGFTLVELLAVIVILGVLLLIAVPAVSNIIESSKRKSFGSTANLIIENVESVASLEKVTGTFSTCYITISDDNIKLERGSLGSSPSGYVLVTLVDGKAKGTISYTDGTYTANGTLNNITVSKSGTEIGVPDGTPCTWWTN